MKSVFVRVAFRITLSAIVLIIPIFGLADDPGKKPPDENEKKAVRAVIDQLFDGMRAGDGEMVRSVFDTSAVMRSVGSRQGKPVMSMGSVERFVNVISSPRDEVYDERIWDVEINVDGDLASAWMKYAFYRGDTFSHCGVNSFQLFKSEDGWKVVFLIDTRRREPCDAKNG